MFVSTSLLTTCPGWRAEATKSLSAASPRLRAAASSETFILVAASSSHLAGSNSVVVVLGAAGLSSSAGIVVILQGYVVVFFPFQTSRRETVTSSRWCPWPRHRVGLVSFRCSRSLRKEVFPKHRSL